MLNSQKIAANSSFFLFALVLQKVLSFVYFTILARTLGAELTGRYFFAISLATMFSVLMDLGLSPVLTREVARDTQDTKLFFRQVFSLKLFFTLFSIVILLLLNFFLFSDDPVQPLVYLATLIVAIDSFTLLFYAFIRGQQNLRFEAMGTVIFQLIVMCLGLLALFFSQSLFLVITVLFVASLFNFVFSGLILKIKFKTKINFLWQKDLLYKIFLLTWPFAMSAIFAKVYAYVDTFLLKMFLGDIEVGFYSVAYKITFAWQFIPLGLVAALYPAFAHLFKNNPSELAKIFNKSFLYLGLIALPILTGIIVLAPEIVLQVYRPDFFGAILPLQILIASLVFLFINFVLSNLLNAANQQKINTRNLGLTMVFNVILNLLLIPILGVWGAALTSSLSTLILFSLNLYASSKIVKLSPENIKHLFLGVLASALMAILVLYLKTIIWWPLTILIGAVFYLLFLFVFKVISSKDFIFWKTAILKK